MRLTTTLTFLLLLSAADVCFAVLDLSGDRARENAIGGNYRIDYGKHGANAVRQLCVNLLKVQNFIGFDYCLEQWQKHYVTADGELETKAGISTRWFTQDYTNALFSGLKAEAALARSNLAEAREHGEVALKGLRGMPAQISRNLLGRKVDKSSLKISKAELGPPVLGTMAVIEGLSGDTEAAETYLRELEKINVKCFLCGRYEPEKRARLARGYLSVGKYDKAFEAITNEKAKGAKLTEEALFKLNPAYYLVAAVTGATKGKMDDFMGMESAAMLCHTLDRLKASSNEQCWDRLLEERFIDVFGAIKFMALSRSGAIKQAKSDSDAALPLLEEAINLLEEQRSSLALDTNKMGFVSDKLAPYRNIIELHVQAGRFDTALSYAERAKSRALVDLLASRGDVKPKNAAIEDDLAEIASAEDVIASIDLSGSGLRSANRGLLLEKRETIRQAAPQFASLRTVSAPEIAKLQSHLEADEAILEYYGYDDDYYVFVMTQEGVVGTRIDGSSLLADINAFRATIQNPEDSTYLEKGGALYNQLVQPVTGYLTNVKSLTIVPHGPMHYLPFSALSNGNGFLIDHYELRILPSASVLSFIGGDRTAKDSTLILGNPDLGDPNMDLPGAQVEAEAIAGKLSNATLYMRKQASESLIKREGGQYGHLHLASHGVFDPENPLGSGLLLAKDQANDGVLTVSELFELNLDADLVTLSACETALGEITNGDDVVGFTRGFLYAGTDSIVSSLWQVSDAATSILMQSFYDTLNVASKRSSLRAAQLHLKDTEYAHPFYWAAFQLTGES